MFKTAVVTGAASGIGLEISKMLLKNNWTVWMIDKNRNALDKAVYENSFIGGKIEFIYADLANIDDLLWVRDLIFNKTEKLDVLVNNAGIALKGNIEEVNLYDILDTIAVNLTAPLALTKLLLRKLKGGHIITVSSGQAFFRLPPWSIYSATKQALASAFISMRPELKKLKIKSSIVYPFLVKTAFYDVVKTDALTRTAIRFTGQSPEDIAKKVLNLISNNKSKEDTTSIINKVGKIVKKIPYIEDALDAAAFRFLK